MFAKIHYRRCHRCLTVNSVEGDLVTHCCCCRKPLAPFYFFDESKALDLNSSKYYSERKDAAVTKLPHQEYPPIWGLTVYWEL